MKKATADVIVASCIPTRYPKICTDPPKIVRIARRIRVIGMATAAWPLARVNPEIADPPVESQGRNNAANIMMPAEMATPPCTRMSAVCFFSSSTN